MTHFLDKYEEDVEYQKLLAEEKLILEVTESIWENLDKKSWTRKKLAEELGRSAPYVSNLLDGSSNMTLRTLADIAFSFGLVTKFKLCDPKEVGDWVQGTSVASISGDVYGYLPMESANASQWSSPIALQLELVQA